MPTIPCCAAELVFSRPNIKRNVNVFNQCDVRRAHLYVQAAAVAGGNGAQHDDELLADKKQAKKTVRHGRCEAGWATIRDGESSAVRWRCCSAHAVYFVTSEIRGQVARQLATVAGSFFQYCP